MLCIFIEAILMSTLNMQLFIEKRKDIRGSLNHPYLPPNLTQWLTFSGSNYQSQKQASMIPRMSELLKFDDTCKQRNNQDLIY